jgi:tetratricopeptide (TPR) repeat protein
MSRRLQSSWLPVSLRLPALLVGLVVAAGEELLFTQALRPPDDRYVEAVTRYAAGDRAEAMAVLARWPADDLHQELARVRELAGKAAGCGACPARQALARVPRRAAVMLHTDLDATERSAAEVAPVCGDGDHASVAEALALTVVVETGGGDFARRWYLGMAIRRHAGACLEDALRWVRSGLKWFANDARLLLELGSVHEQLGTKELSPTLFLNPLSRGQREHALGEGPGRLQHLDRAARAFERAVAADAELDEARLRLGRVRWRRGDADAAKAALAGVLERSDDRELLYLAHLFMGRIHEDARRLDDAEREYRAALRNDATAQVAGVALSHVLRLGGDTPGSREALAHALEFAGRRDGPDAYARYRVGRADVAEALFERLRDEGRR